MFLKGVTHPSKEVGKGLRLTARPFKEMTCSSLDLTSLLLRKRGGFRLLTTTSITLLVRLM
jgi:hypothetical protein